MQQQPFKNYDIVQIVILLVFILIAFLNIFYHLQGTLFDLAFFDLIGLFWLYSGIKIVRASKNQQQPLHWYTQPSIIFGIGALIFALNQLLKAITPNSYVMYPHLDDILSSIALLFFLAAICFNTRDWWLRRKSMSQQ